MPSRYSPLGHSGHRRSTMGYSDLDPAVHERHPLERGSECRPQASAQTARYLGHPILSRRAQAVARPGSVRPGDRQQAASASCTRRSVAAGSDLEKIRHFAGGQEIDPAAPSSSAICAVPSKARKQLRHDRRRSNDHCLPRRSVSPHGRAHGATRQSFRQQPLPFVLKDNQGHGWC